MPGAQWFSGAELSYPEHIFRDKPGDRVAIRHASELRELGEWTWDELRDADRARRAPACGRWASSAATASSPTCRTSPRRSPPSSRSRASARSGRAARPTSAPARSIDRFAQIEPKVLLTVDGYRYGGKDHDRGELIEKVQGEMPSLERTVTLELPRASAATGTRRSRRPTRRSSSTASRSTTRCGSSTRRAPPACRRRSCTRRAGSCSSTSRSTTSTSTPRRATASSGSPPPAG